MRPFTLSFFLICLSFALSAQRGTKLNILAQDQTGKPLSGIIFTAQSVQQEEFITDPSGFVVLMTPYDKVDVYSDISINLHSNEWQIAEEGYGKELIPLPTQNGATVTLEGRKKGVIRIKLEPKFLAIPIRTTALTPEVTVGYGIQIASLSQANPQALQYYQKLTEMKIEVLYRNGKIIYYYPVETEKEARAIEKSIEMKKIKGLEDVFVIAIEKPKTTQSSLSYRIQVAASEYPLSQKEIASLNEKLKSLKTEVEEKVTAEGKYNYKYFTGAYFKDKEAAHLFHEKVSKFGISANIIPIQ